MSSNGRAKILALQRELNSKLIERQEAIQGILLALIAREHVLLLGPPGVAKSALANQLCAALGGSYFQILLTKFTTPEEVFGPISLKALEEDRYERKLDGYLPTAQIAFVDECYKASSAILNALLTILNERMYDNGARRWLCPLETCIGASNELPQDASLGALHDRFLLRYIVAPVSAQSASALWSLDRTPITTRISASEVSTLQTRAAQVVVSPEITGIACAIRADLASAGVYVSDRRFIQARKLIQASAALGGRARAEGGDLHALSPALWTTPDKIEPVRSIVARHAGAVPNDPGSPLPPSVQEWMAEMEILRREVTKSGVGSAVAGSVGAARIQKASEVIKALRSWKDDPNVRDAYTRFQAEVVAPLIQRGLFQP